MRGEQGLKTRSRGRVDHIRRIFEAALTNHAQELTTALRCLYRSLTTTPHHHPHPRSSLPCSPLSTPSLPLCCCHHHPHPHDHFRHHGQQRVRCGARPGVWRQVVRCQTTDPRQLSYAVSQVITSDAAKDSASLAFEKLQANYTSEEDACCNNFQLTPPQSPERRSHTAEHHVSTPLHLAAALGLEAVVKVLLRQKDVVNWLSERDSLAHTPLNAAVISQKLGVIRLLLKKTVSLPAWHLHVCVLKEIVNDALKLAISMGNVEVVGEILKEQTAQNLASWTSQMLWGPVAFRRLPLVRLLLRSGYNAWHTSCFMTGNPLHLAVYMYRNRTQEELEIVRSLLQYGADPNQQCIIPGTPPTYASALHIAVMTYPHAVTSRLLAPFPDMVQLLLEHKANPNARDKSRESPLFRVRPGVCIQTLRLLLRYGANPWQTNLAKDVYLTSPKFLFHADENSGFVFIKALLDHDPRLVNAKGHKGQTLLHNAVLKPRLFWFLLSHGANPDLRDHDGETVMDHLLTLRSTVPELTQRCLTLLMCVKVKASFRRKDQCRMLLCYADPLTATPGTFSRGQVLQMVMIVILFEVGYLNANDQFQYFLQTTDSDLPDSMKKVLKHLAGKPSSLASACRRAIVKASGPRSKNKQLLKSLLQNTPGPIKRYLQFSDLVDLVASTIGKSVEEIQSLFSPLPPTMATRNLCLGL